MNVHYKGLETVAISEHQTVVDFIKKIYGENKFIPLHEPSFSGNEREYVLDAIDSTFVSSVGEYVNRFERMMSELAGTSYAVATVNGTSALHMALILCDVKANDEVLTQALTFVATSNAISYTGAKPVFIDVDRETMGMSPSHLLSFLQQNCEKGSDGYTFNKLTKRRIKACIPMHTFGFPCKLDELALICEDWNIDLIEDAAESVGSYYKGKHTGSYGKVGIFSFNGNKILTCGGGGAIVTNDERIAKRGKHLTTQAKAPHAWEFFHNETGFNYRMPNLNAALACAQLENLEYFLGKKRRLANIYRSFFNETSIRYVNEPAFSSSNFWLNCIMLKDKIERDEFLETTNSQNVMTRPIWQLMFKLPMFSDCQRDEQQNAHYLEERIVNIPSSVISGFEDNFSS